MCTLLHSSVKNATDVLSFENNEDYRSDFGMQIAEWMDTLRSKAVVHSLIEK